MNAAAGRNGSLPMSDQLFIIQNNIIRDLAAKGNCTLYVTTYTGTGTYGETSPNSLTFPAPPALVLISGGGAPVVGGNSQGTAFAIRNGTLFVTGIGSSIRCWPAIWSADGKTMSWYAFNARAEGQLTAAGVTYTVVALLPAE